MTPEPDHLRCPTCDAVLGALAGRQGDRPWKAPYTDPVDGVRLYRCIVHGRAEVQPDGTVVLKADEPAPPPRRRA